MQDKKPNWDNSGLKMITQSFTEKFERLCSLTEQLQVIKYLESWEDCVEREFPAKLHVACE